MQTKLTPGTIKIILCEDSSCFAAVSKKYMFQDTLVDPFNLFDFLTKII